MLDYRSVKLGKHLPRHDIGRRLRLAKYLPATPPAPPPSADWTGGVTDWGMMLNDQLGDCTIAALGHAIQAVSLAAAGVMETVPDEIIQSYYEKWDGYDPSDPATDQGGNEVDVLNHFRAESLATHELKAYADPDSGDLDMARRAIAMFGVLYVGIGLPITAQDQTVWDYVAKNDGSSQPYSWGGHAVVILKYADNFTCVTWGGLKDMTPTFYEKYVDESHALLLADWLKAGNVSPSNLDLDQLELDLTAIAA